MPTKQTYKTTTKVRKVVVIESCGENRWIIKQDEDEPSKLVVRHPCGDSQSYERQELLAVAKAIINNFSK